MPGLLQTQEYARAVVLLGHGARRPAEIDRRVALRMQRQQLLTGRTPPQLWAVVDEAALRRPIGGAEVMRDQLEHAHRGDQAARTSGCRSSRSPPVATPPPAAPSPSCASPTRTCPTSSTSNSSPAPSTWTSATTSTTTRRPWSGSASRPSRPSGRRRSSAACWTTSTRPDSRPRRPWPGRRPWTVGRRQPACPDRCGSGGGLSTNVLTNADRPG